MAYNAQQQAVIDEATRRAQANGTTPEREAWNYAQANNMSPLAVDEFFGWNSGTTGKWGVDNGLAPAPQGNSYMQPAAQPATSANLGMGGGVQALGADQRASIIAEATRRSQSNGSTPEAELYRYAQGNKISNGDVDKYMGFQSGATDAWAGRNGMGGGAPAGGGGALPPSSVGANDTGMVSRQPSFYDGDGGNLGMGYNPKQNPYLKQMGVDVGNQMFDQWSRNTLPSIRSGAMAAGGFGGSRQGVVEANGLNDMNRQYGQALTSMYGNDWNQQQGRNLQQQGLNNSYDLGLKSNDLQNRSVNNSYDLGLRSSDLGFSNLDANINQNNFNNQLASANFGMGVYNTLNNQTQAGIQAGTNIQNTPLDYQKYFTNSANGVGSGYGTSNTSQTNQGNPWLGALGGAMMGNQIQKNWG